MKMNSTRMRITTIAKKELVEFVRDWRTIVAILVIPVLMFPLLFILFPLLLEAEAQELDELIVDVELQADDLPDDFQSALEYSSINLTFAELDAVENLTEPGTAMEKLRSGEVDAVVRVRANNSTWQYAVLHMSTSEQSNEARSRVLLNLGEWEQNETRNRLVAVDLDPDATLNPLQWNGSIAQGDVASKGEQAGLALSLFIPLVLAVWTFSSAIQPSIDMTAGERERGTLEALLGLPCTRAELLFGKWLAVATITAAGVLLQIAGLTFAIGYLATSDIISAPTMTLGVVALLCVAVLLFAITVVAFELALAMRAHSVKEAGSVLGPAVLLILFPALFTQVINLDGIELFWFAIPVVNVLLALRELLLNRVVPVHVLVWMVSSAVYATLAALYAARQFNREDIVTTLS